LRDRSFEINLTLIAGQGRDFFPAGDQFRKDFRRLKLKAQLLGLAPFDIQSAPALIAPVERPHQLPRPTLAITKAKPFLDQDANRFDGPSAARLSAWHRFLLKQLTELVQFLRLQVTLAMLPSPARIILQAVQASLLVGLRPATDRLFIHKEDVGGLPITIAFGHEQQRMVALPLMSIEFLVFVPSRSFQEVWLAQHCASFFRKRCSTRRLYSVSAGSISWCAGHIGVNNDPASLDARLDLQAASHRLVVVELDTTSLNVRFDFHKSLSSCSKLLFERDEKHRATGSDVSIRRPPEGKAGKDGQNDHRREINIQSQWTGDCKHCVRRHGFRNIRPRRTAYRLGVG